MTLAQTLSPELRGLSVRRIKEFAFFINEQLFAQKQGESNNQVLQVDFSLHLSFTPETNLVFLLVRIYYQFPGALPGEVLSDITVQNVFELEDLKRFQVAPSEIILPSAVISTIVGLSLSHTRALMARNLSGTMMQENVMALVDPVTVTRHFFPRMFEQPTPSPNT
jgi:hypothetical protein